MSLKPAWDTQGNLDSINKRRKRDRQIDRQRQKGEILEKENCLHSEQAQIFLTLFPPSNMDYLVFMQH